MARLEHLLTLTLALPLTACGSSDDSGASESLTTTGLSTTTTQAGSESVGETSDATSDSGDGDGDSGDGDSGDGDSGDGDSGDGDGDSGDGDGDSGDGDSGDGDGDSTGTSTTGGDCLECSITLATTASSMLEVTGPVTVLGLMNLEATNQSDELIDAPVYGLFEWGQGRIIATADTNILYGEMTDCPLWEWLGDTPTLPKVGAFGKTVCNGLGNNLGNYPDHTYLGSTLPAQYVNNPGALKAEYDVVIFCTQGPISADVSNTLADYAYAEGGGLYLASEYYPWADDDDVAAINSIANQFNVNFIPEWLNWGSADGVAEFSCFPLPE